MIPVLESQNLIYEPMNLKYVNSNYLDWLNDKEVNKYLEIYNIQTLESLNKYVEVAIEKKIYFWAIIQKSTNKHIGNIKIDPINTYHKYGEYGILIGDKSSWGKGYGKEASKAIIDFCFENLKLNKIYLGVVSENITAMNLYENLGFKQEGLYINHGKYDNKICDIARMAIFNPKIKIK